MIDQQPVPGLHLPQVLQGQIVLDPVPDGRLLAGQVIETVRGRLSLHYPMAAHYAPVLRSPDPPLRDKNTQSLRGGPGDLQDRSEERRVGKEEAPGSETAHTERKA